MKMRKQRITALIVILSMLFNTAALLPLSVCAQASGTCGGNLTWMLDDSGTLTISGTGDMYDYTSGESPWYGNASSINEIIIDYGVTSIGKYAFSILPKLESVTIANSVIAINSNAFFYCDLLKEINIPESVKKIEDSAFLQCYGLTRINMSYGITEIGDNAFANCYAVSNIIIPESVVSIGSYAFNSCQEVQSVYIPANVQYIGKLAFSGCDNLQEIIVSEKNTFYKSADGVLFNKEMSNLICCPPSKSCNRYIIPDTVKCIKEYAFSSCRSLGVLIIPEGVRELENGAFMYYNRRVLLPRSIINIKGRNTFMSGYDIDHKPQYQSVYSPVSNSQNIITEYEYNIDFMWTPFSGVSVHYSVDGSKNLTLSIDAINPLATTKWALGSREISYFKNNGTEFTGDSIDIGEAETITLYSKDEGNIETVKTVNIPYMSVSASDIIYGQNLSHSKISNSGDVSGTWIWKNANISPNAGITDYEAVFTPDDSSYPIAITASVNVKTEKANPSYTVPTGLSKEYRQGLQLSDVALPSGWAWDNRLTNLFVPGGGYNATYTPSDTNNYNIISGIGVPVEITKHRPIIGGDNSEIGLPTASAITYTQLLSASMLTAAENDTISGTWSWKDSSIKPNAGTASYTAVWTPVDTNNYEPITAEVQVTTNKAIPTYNVPTELREVYAPALKLGDITLPTGWAWENDNMALSVPGGIYKAMFIPADTNNYEIVRDIDINVEIVKALPEYTVPIGLTAVYNPALKLSDISLPKGFTWSLPDMALSVPGGTYTATFTPEDTVNYETVNNINIAVEVTKRTPEIGSDVAMPTASDIIYGQSLADSILTSGVLSITINNDDDDKYIIHPSEWTDFQAALSAVSGKAGEVQGTWTWQDSSVKPNAGTRKFIAVFTPADMNNYTVLSAQVQVITHKAIPEYTVPTGLTEVYNPGLMLSDITLPDGFTWNEPGTKLFVPGGVYAATFIPSDINNYEIVSDVKINVEITKYTPIFGSDKNSDVKIPVASDIIYEQSLADSMLTKNSEDKINGEWTWQDSSVKPNAGTAEYTAVWTPVDTDNYEPFAVQVQVITNKAIPNYTVPTGLTAEYRADLSLSDIALTEGFTWNEPGTKLFVPGGTYKMTFTPNDTDNYEVISDIDADVSVTKYTPVFGVDIYMPTASDIVYGQSLADSTLMQNPLDKFAGTWAWNDLTVKPSAGIAEYKATFTFTDAENYNSLDNISVLVKVDKAALTVTDVSALNKIYDGTSDVIITDASLTGVCNNDNVVIDTSNLKGSLVIPDGSHANVGEYSEVTLPTLALTGSAMDNYTIVQPTGVTPLKENINITKAKLDGVTETRQVSNYYANTYCWSLTNLRPIVKPPMQLADATKYSIKSVNIDGAYYDENTAQIVNVNEIEVPIKSVDTTKTGNIGKIVTTLSYRNFEDLDCVINLLSSNKASTQITGVKSMGSVTYTGKEIIGYTGTPKSTHNGDYEITYTGRGNTTHTQRNKAPTDVGQYRVTIRIPESNKDYIGIVYLDFEIVKAESKVIEKPSIKLMSSGGQTHILFMAGNALGGELQYSLDGKVYSPEIPSVKETGTYTLYYKVIGDKNHTDVEPQTVTMDITVRKNGGGRPVTPETNKGENPSDNPAVPTPTPDAPTPAPVYDPPYITGYDDGTFHPDAPITRAETTAAMLRAKQIAVSSESSKFSDVSPKHWANGFISAAALKDIVHGYGDNTFMPDNNITRAEFAKMTVKLCNYEVNEAKLSKFNDVNGHWAQKYIAALEDKDIINGYDDNTFKPDELISRAEAVAIINRAVKRKYKVADETGFIDITYEHWAYDEIIKTVE